MGVEYLKGIDRPRSENLIADGGSDAVFAGRID
jgi:hypothetical protein